MIERVTLAPCGHLPVHLKYEKGTKTIICELCAEHDKRVRAEVLAACIAAIKLVKVPHGDLVHGGTYQESSNDQEYFVEALEKLQPAAEALEEYVKNLPFSEIARIKGIPAVAKLGKTYDRPDFYATEDE